MENQKLSSYSFNIISSVIGLILSSFIILINNPFFSNLWISSGEFFETHWNTFVDYYGEDLFYYRFYGTTIISTTVFWCIGGLYMIMDITNKPVALRKYKVQPGTNEPLDKEKFKKMLPQIMFNIFCLNTLVIYLMTNVLPNRDNDLRKIPNIFTIMYQIFFMVIIEEFGFYYGHRLFHYKWFYRYIHKKHHEWTAPVAWSAVYAHPVEHLFCNLLPLGIGVLIIQPHIVTTWIFFTLAIIFTLNEHSGYHLPFLPSPEAHDYHHFKFNQCYGVLGLLDTLHGTNKQFVASKGFQRHKMLFGFKSAHELLP